MERCFGFGLASGVLFSVWRQRRSDNTATAVHARLHSFSSRCVSVVFPLPPPILFDRGSHAAQSLANLHHLISARTNSWPAHSLISAHSGHPSADARHRFRILKAGFSLSPLWTDSGSLWILVCARRVFGHVRIDSPRPLQDSTEGPWRCPRTDAQPMHRRHRPSSRPETR